MIDTMSVAEVMWDRGISDHIKNLMAISLNLTTSQTKQLALFLAGCHDIGKATPGFQGLVEEMRDRLKEYGYNTGSYDIHHGKLTSYLFLNECPFTKLDYVQRLSMAFSIGVHHGNMFSVNHIEQVYSTHIGTGIWKETRSRMIDILIDISHIERSIQSEIRTEKPGIVFALLSGFTSICDWIASSEEYFPYVGDEEEITSYLKASKTRAEAAIDTLHWDRPTSMVKESSFTELFPFIVTPNALQISTLELSKELFEPSLLIIEAPMGMGKTEAALFIQHHYAKRGIPGSYIGLPTQTTANQMFQRVVGFLQNQKNDVLTNLHLLHGKALFSDEYHLLQSSDSEHDPEGVIADEWFTYRKRGLLSPYGVGTIDQALLSVIPTKHFFVRLFGLAGKTVILDEVHAYDVYMSTLLDRMISWLQALGTSVVVLSATLTSHRRRELLNAFSHNISGVSDCSYPRISWIHGDQAGVAEVPYGTEKTVSMKWTHYDDIPSIIANTLNNGGCMAIICNTVQKSQDTYRWISSEFLDSDIEIGLFHARYPYGARKRKEDRYLRDFGKNARDPHRKSVLIATQVIEQSLDLDFDIMITELAPVDLILQRMGRLHRHARERPEGLLEPTIYILRPLMEENGSIGFGPSRFVYAEYILLRTYLSLQNRNTITLPKDIEILVEWVYGGGDVDADEAIIAQMGRAKKGLEEEKERLNILARSTIVMKPSESKPWEYINEMLVEEKPEVHQTLRARTRDTGPSLEVICLFETDKGISLDSDGHKIVSLDNRPCNREELEQLLNQSATLSHPAIIFHILDNVEIPGAWRRSSIMKYTRPLVFKPAQSIKGEDTRYQYTCGDFMLILDGDLGIIYTKVAS